VTLEKIILTIQVITYSVRFFFSLFFWPHSYFLFCGAPVLVVLFISLHALRTQHYRIGAISLVILAILFVWTAPPLVTATFPDGYKLTFLTRLMVMVIGRGFS